MNIGNWKATPLALAILCATQPLVAEDIVINPTPVVEDSPAPEQEACQLHVWPGEDFHTVYYGWGHGGTVDGSQKGREGYDRVLADPLSTARQANLLEAQPIAELLGLDGYQVTIHANRLPSREIRTKLERHVADAPPCYAELMIDTIVLQSHVLGGRGLNIVYRFRQFDAAPAATRVFGTYVVQPLEIDLTDKAEPDPAVFTSELERAFNQNLEEFAAHVKAPQGKKK